MVGSNTPASHGQISGQWRDAMTQALAETDWKLPTPRATRCGSSTETTDLLPTPTTSDTNGAGAHGSGGSDLRTAVSDALMPTPRAGDGEKGGPNQRGSSGDLMLPSAVTTLPTPTARDWKNVGDPQKTAGRMDDRGQPLGEVVVNSLLPTPSGMNAANDPGSVESWVARRDRMLALGINGNGIGTPLGVAVQLPPTTTSKDSQASGSAGYGGHDFSTLTDATVRQPSHWGKYAAAIARWETVTRAAPEPTNITDGYLKALAKRLARQHAKPVGMRGSLKPRRQLAARFSEWMMGVPLGWITGVPGVTRNEALKAAGNGVVPQQAAEALRFLLDMPTGRDIANAHEPDDLFELLALGGVG